MKRRTPSGFLFPTTAVLGAYVVLLAGAAARAEVKTVVNHNTGDQATPGFKFKDVPAPAKAGAAAALKFEIVDGQRDPFGADLDVLHDGKFPAGEDEPAGNFFFAQQTPGGRIRVDLGSAVDVKRVNTYSWHPDTRGPQVYVLYAADGAAKDFNAAPKAGTDPETCGWKKLAAVDTRPKDGEGGGQYGVSVLDTAGPLGKFRYLLLDASRTEADDPFGNTFYSEIDVVADAGPAKDAAAAEAKADAANAVAAAKADKTDKSAKAPKAEITIDTSETPDLAEWAEKTLRPVCEEWYPQIVEMLPSDKYTAPQKFSITFRKDKKGVADTGGTKINCAADWYRKELKREAVGSIVHEMVHVVQQYGRARGGARNPGWLVEGVADYVRWYKFEPQSHGTDIRDPSKAKYDASYRVTANFLNYVTEKYDKDLVKKLNAAMRDGKYSDDIWKQATKKSVEELGQEWKDSLGKKDKGK